MNTTLVVPETVLRTEETAEVSMDATTLRDGDLWTHPITGQEIVVGGPHWPPHPFEDEDAGMVVTAYQESEGGLPAAVEDYLDAMQVVLGRMTVEQLKSKWNLTS